MRTLTFLILVCLGVEASASNSPVRESEHALKKRIAVLLQEKHPSARIRIAEMRSIQSKTQPTGELRIRPESKPGSAWIEGAPDINLRVAYSALVQVFVAKRRIAPREPLRADDFEIREIDVLDPRNLQYHGMILTAAEEIDNLEARQTILPGGYILSTGIQKQPDLRRGEGVRIRIRAGALAVQSRGIAQDEVNIGETVRVTSQATKKLLTGKLIEKGLVEVTL